MKFVRLGNIAIIGAGQGAPQKETDFSDEGFPFIRAGHLDDLLNSRNSLVDIFFLWLLTFHF